MGILDYLRNKNNESEIRKSAREQGVVLRDITRDELGMINFSQFSGSLIEKGLLPKDYALVYNLTEVHPLDKDSSGINYIGLTFKSFIRPDDIKLNIKALNVSCAKGESNIYRYNRGMSDVWIDMCYDVLLKKQQMSNAQTDISMDKE